MIVSYVYYNFVWCDYIAYSSMVYFRVFYLYKLEPFMIDVNHPSIPHWVCWWSK